MDTPALPPYLKIPPGHPSERYYEDWQGFTPCITEGCNTWSGPQARENARVMNKGTVVCPSCQEHYEAIEPLATVHGGKPGGYSRVGITNTQMGQLAEHLVHTKVTPGWKWGKITFWQPHLDAGSGSGGGHPLDGMSVDEQGRHWGIEVKSTNYENVNPYFILGKDEKESKNAYAAAVWAEHQAEYNAPPQIDHFLGVGVAFDFTRSVADVWVKEMARGKWTAKNGRTVEGWGQWYPRESSSELHVGELKFDNPFMNPRYEGPFYTKQAPAKPADDHEIPF